MNPPYLPNTLELNFIQNNLEADLSKMALGMKKDENVNSNFVLSQIAGRQKIKTKLPSWFENFELIFPKTLSIEQCSSELTASFKASLVSGKNYLDLTLGMGIDFWKMSQSFQMAIGVERDSELSEVTNYNLAKLGLGENNYKVVNQLANDFLKDNQLKFDWVYLDPARRDLNANKIVFLADCEPNILSIKSSLFDIAKSILLKLSPMLDIDLAVHQLVDVEQVWVIAVNNEVKELLIALNKNASNSPKISCLNFDKKGNQNSFFFDKILEKESEVNYRDPQKYLYEPHAAILKAGGFKSIAAKYQLYKLHQHSHLYTSAYLNLEFPGRIFEVNAIENLDKIAVRSHLKSDKANITVRNFPLSVAELRAKLKLKEGGTDYIFATTNLTNKKIIIISTKIK